MRIAVIILHCNRPQEVAVSLRRMEGIRDRHEFIVVDNGSKPKHVALLESLPEMKSVRLVKLPHNLGICAWDFAAFSTDAEIVIRLDDDSHIKSSSLDILSTRFANESDLGAIPLAVEGGPFLCPDRPSFRRGTSVGFIGCGVAFRKSALIKVGAHDPNFFIYSEEWDLSIRLLNAGYEIDREDSIKVEHRVSASAYRNSSRLIVYTCRNETLIARKYFRKTRFLCLLIRIFINNLKRYSSLVGALSIFRVTQGMLLGLLDPRLLPQPTLSDPDAILARFEAWMFAFRPILLPKKKRTKIQFKEFR